jgi:ubiquinone biosynthesis accessory factor UbiJ
MLLSALESSLNRNIAASSAATILCARLKDKSLCLQLNGLPNAFELRSDGERVRISTADVSNADAKLSGSPIGLLTLARKQATSTGNSGVRIEGDAEVAQRFSELLKLAKPDLEEELSRWVGDVAAHQLGVTAKHLFEFGRRAAKTLTQNVGEYLSEESRDVPHRFEVDEFVRGVDTLRDDAERLAARLTLLEQRRNSLL